MLTILFSLLVLLLSAYIIASISKPKNYPPGPKWYPFFGCSSIVQNLARKHGSQAKALAELAKEHSTRVLGMKLGSELVVAVYGEKNIRQIFTGREFDGRPDSFFFRLRCLGKRMGITFTDGPLWREHRQFTVKQLRNVGFGKTKMESTIQKEMLKVVQQIKNKGGHGIAPRNVLATAVMNVLWTYVAGEIICEDRLKTLLELLNARSAAFTVAGGWLNEIPWIRFLFPELSGYSLLTRINKQISDIIEEAINKHKTNSVEGNDFIYAFLNEMKEDKENKQMYTEEHLKIICLDLLIAGSQTSSNALAFALLVALRNKSIQDKIYEEIKTVVGDRTPGWADNTSMVYTSAFILEIFRYFQAVPIGGPRRVLEDTVIDGYHIPKETTILIGLGNLQHDPSIHSDPEEFRPERFIDSNTGELRNTEHYHFGMGRRRCPGDSLARSFIFIFLVGLLQHFKVECSNGVLPSDVPNLGILSAPQPYTAEFICRQ